MLVNCQLQNFADITVKLKAGLDGLDGDKKSTYRASASSDDAFKGQGIRDTKRYSSRALGIDGGLANGLGLLVAQHGSPS